MRRPYVTKIDADDAFAWMDKLPTDPAYGPRRTVGSVVVTMLAVTVAAVALYVLVVVLVGAVL